MRLSLIHASVPLRPARTSSRIAATVVLALLGCGGSEPGDTGGSAAGGTGGGSGAGGPAPGTNEGAFIAAGVRYATETQAGITDDNGMFTYLPGEDVMFSVGTVVLGAARAAERVDPFDLVGIEPPIGRREIVDAAPLGGAYQRAIAIMILLASLDTDDEYTNGVQVDPRVDALFEGAEIDFGLPVNRPFGNQFALRSRLGQANIQGFFDPPHGPANPARATRHLYQTVDVDPRIFGPATSTFDPIDPGLNDSIAFYEYDDLGRLVRAEEAPGVERTYRLEYDRNWNVVRLTNIVGSSTFVDESTYDSLGNLTMLRRSSFNEDDEEFLDSTLTRKFDENGSLMVLERDYDGDGALNYRETYAYDDEGRVTLFEIDSGADGSINRITTWSYDDEVNTVRQSIDFAVDGPANDRVLLETFNEAGLVVESSLDIDVSDGVVDEVTTFTYDDRGLRLVEETRDGDGVLLFRDERMYNENGFRIEEATDEDGDGVTDTTVTRTVDEAGRLTEEVRLDLSEGPTLRRAVTYDERGNWTRRTTDAPVGGPLEREETAAYDEDDNQTEYNLLATQSGSPARRTRTFVPGGWFFVLNEAGLAAGVTPITP